MNLQRDAPGLGRSKQLPPGGQVVANQALQQPGHTEPVEHQSAQHGRAVDGEPSLGGARFDAAEARRIAVTEL